MKLSIVILCWNDRKVIEDCLHSIYETTRSVKFEVIVSDNGSTDGTGEMIAERFPQFRLRLERRLKTLNQVSREQIGLLRQFRGGGDEEVRNALLLTINCAAAGFGATG